MKTTLLYIFLFAAVLSGCRTENESNLSAEEIEYIRDLGLLEEGEAMEMFECNGGFSGMKESGNFITDRRIASYWISEGDKDLHWAFFENEIDSISFTDLVSKLTYASYLTVYKTDGSNFKVYVDADSTRTYQFYHHALENWEKVRQNR